VSRLRRAAPLVEEAARPTRFRGAPRFPLPFHTWSYEAAIDARYFDTHSKALGNEFRDYIFSNQLEVTPQNLRGFTEKFAAEHKIDLPFVVDPDGKLAAWSMPTRNSARRSNCTHAHALRRQQQTLRQTFCRSGGRSQLYALIDAMMKD